MRVVHFIPLILGLLGFSSQPVFACTGALAPGCDYCKTDPSRCGIPTAEAVNAAKEKGKEECRLSPWINCQIPTGNTDADKIAGKFECLNNLTNCQATVNGVVATSGLDQLESAKANCLNNLGNCTATVAGVVTSGSKVKDTILLNAPVPDTTALVEAAKDTGKSECLRNLKGCTAMVVGVQSGNEQLESAKASCLNDLEHCTATGALKSGAEVKQTILSGVTPLDTTALKNTGKLDCLNDLEKCEATTETKTTKKGAELIPRYDITLKQLKLPLVKNGDTPAISNATMQLCPPFVENTTWTFQLIIPKFNGVDLSDKDCSQLNSGAIGLPAKSTTPSSN